MSRSTLPGFNDFSAKTHKALAAKGVRVICSAGHCGNVLAYKLERNGQMIVRTFREVLEMAS